LPAPANRRILEYAAAHGFTLISTGSDFELLVRQIPAANIFILHACDYPTDVAAKVPRPQRNPQHRVAQFQGSLGSSSINSCAPGRAHNIAGGN
jgi:hypothetical protein